jgi:acyl carrier protein
MAAVPASEIRGIVLDRYADELAAKGLTPSDVRYDFDLLLEGVVDSFGIVELIAALEERFGIAFDFDELEADDLTRIGPLADYVERKAARV